ncbi:hypothetical protein OG455_02715 [Kitasatospora sp. NBC_01287]|uniref:hypothetical protein n=1 Tax=Kitasatospora sp. NBC_01287 TaxID=2903573 RepID=UPI00224FA543|nr:hypothetical protein [Kitasatospora sp. NBC_01287]MCX4744439.1 hypothetical protein [Kitasatospora sp. NBC_01287]
MQHLIRAQAGDRRSDALARLRAAAHLDPVFRDAVIEELVENPHRVPPPAHGLDLVTVLKECVTTRRWAVTRGLSLLGLPLLVIPVDSQGALVPLFLLLGVRCCLFLARELSRLLERLAERLGGADGGRWIRRAGSLVWLAALVSIAVMLYEGVGGLWGDGWTRPAEHACGYDYAIGDLRCTVGTPTTNSALWAALIVLLGWTAVAAVDGYRRLTTLHLLATGRAPVPADGVGVLAARYQELRQRQADPDVIYSDHAPFIGAGVEVDHWSFAIELRPDEDAGAEGLRALDPRALETALDPRVVAPLTTPTIHAHLRRELLRLGAPGPGPGYPGDPLHAISIEDHVFKSGMRLGPAQDWSGTGPNTAFAHMAPYAARAAAEQLGRPAGQAPATWWPDSLDLAAEERLRHYLAVRVSSWSGEVVLTVYTRAQAQGGLLYLESRAFVLPPIARAYHAIDTVLPPDGAGDWTLLLGRSLGSSLGLVSRALPDLFTAVRSAVRSTRRRVWYRRMCAANRAVDHGPTRSVRELGAESGYHQLFQEMDVQRFLKSITSRTMSAVADCLKEHGYRVDEYEVRQNVVINNGIQVGGNVTGNVQSGSHARADYQRVSTPQPRIGTDRD